MELLNSCYWNSEWKETLKYSVEFKSTALKDLEKIEHGNTLKILRKIKVMEDDLKGDIKKLTNFTPE